MGFLFGNKTIALPFYQTDLKNTPSWIILTDDGVMME